MIKLLWPGGVRSYREVASVIWLSRSISAEAKLVALRLAEHWPGIEMPPIAELSQKCGLGSEVVRTALYELETEGLISLESKP